MSEELTPKACPHCGAEQTGGISCFVYDFSIECGMVQTSVRRAACYERELNQLRTTNAELLSALRGLLEEYTDREFQFGGDCLWQKHEDADTIDKARAAITKATEKPDPSSK